MLTSLQNDYFIRSLPANVRAEQIARRLLERPECFLEALLPKSLTDLVPVEKYGDKPSNALWEMRAGGSWPPRFVPIRAFRTATPHFPLFGPIVRTFLSSGTTSGPEGRSKSGFSQDGENLYRTASLLGFIGMLRQVLPANLETDTFMGISLIPTVEVWPDSSLARMVHWLKDLWPIQYVNYEDPKDVATAVEICHKAGRPVFVFGTAFHLIDLLDLGPKFTLPKHSIVIETGGTKGKTRSVTRTELYELIARGFSCSEERIVSEYGMCELASQAYDFIPYGKTVALTDRRFHFPYWAPIKVMSQPEEAKSEGIGALTVWDIPRIDVPAAIQTEDLAEVFLDGTFRLLGRISTAPLKGCSLKVDEVEEKETNKQSLKKIPGEEEHESSTHMQQLLAYASRETLESHAKKLAPTVRRWLLDVLCDQEFKECLIDELGSRELAQNALADITMGLPTDTQGFMKAAVDALGERQTLPQEWIVIPPSTHPVAPIHTLACLFTLGVCVKMRLTNPPSIRGHSTSLHRVSYLAKQAGLLEETLPPTWRLSIKKPTRSSLVVFGDDDTVAAMKDFTRGEVVGFGNALAATWTTVQEWNASQSASMLKLMIKDNVALSQRGCMSARLNFVSGELSCENKNQLIRLIEDKLKDLTKPTIASQTARSLEVVRLKQLGAEVFGAVESGYTIAFAKEPKDVSQLLSKLELVFVFLESTKSEVQFYKVIEQFAGLKMLGLSDDLFKRFGEITTTTKNSISIEPVRLGAMNAPRLSGRHLGRVIFAETH